MHEAMRFRGPGMGLPIAIDQVDQGSLDQAVFCGAFLQKSGRLGKLKLGVVDPTLPKGDQVNGLNAGRVVFFEPYSDGKVIVEMPYHQDTIKSGQSGLTCTSVMVNVPSRAIRPLVASV